MIPKKVIEALSPIEILTLTIYGESRGESIEGQIAVANVIKNRFYHKINKYKNIGEVCLEPKQFSCWNEDDPNYVILVEIGEKFLTGGSVDRIIQQCLYIATGVTKGILFDNTNNARNYLTMKLFFGDKPEWVGDIKKINYIIRGTQVFFNA